MGFCVSIFNAEQEKVVNVGLKETLLIHDT